MAKLLGISTNALSCRMRKGKCDLKYRFDGRNFLFKRPREKLVAGPPLNPPDTKKDCHLQIALSRSGSLVFLKEVNQWFAL